MKALVQRLAWVILAVVVATGTVRADSDIPLARTCTDMDGHSFSWSWSNVPFASTCTGESVENTDAMPASRNCDNGCAATAIACISQTFGSGDQGQSCTATNAACLKACQNLKGP